MSPPRIHSRRHPTRSQSTTFLTSLSFVFLIFLSIVLLCPVAVKAKDSSLDYGTVIGIVYKGGRVEIIANDQGHRITPSWVGFNGNERLIGDSAKNAFHSNPKNTIFDVKRLIGRKWDEKEVQQDLKHLPFKVKNKGGQPIINVKYQDKMRDFTPEEISAMILTRMKETAEAYLGHGVTHAVVTVPAYFNDAQRQATKDAGEIAGLKILRVLNEPTAAALAYGLDKKGDESKIIVYDLGGGTFDVSLLSIEDGVFEVLATSGDTHLGGEDFDNRVIDYFVNAYEKRTGTNVTKNQRAMGKLKKAVEDAKRTLSTQQSAKIEIESFEGGNDFLDTLTRAKFEELNMELFKKTMKPVERVLKDAGVKKSEIDEIVLVGGSTRIPKVQQLLKEYFGKEPSKGVNPDEAVAYGAAVQAGILGGVEGPGVITLIDINSLTLGIETTGGVFTPIVKRNSVIPTKKSQIFSTAADNQNTVSIKVYEGERGQTKFNHLLGEFDLTGIPSAPKGVPQIEVTFELDSNSILTIRASDKGTGKSESIVISNVKGRLTQEQIDRMVADGEKFAAEDQLHKKHTEALNSLSNYVYSLKSQFAEKDGISSKLRSPDKKALQDIIREGNDWIDEYSEEANLEELEEKLAELQLAVNPIIGELYSKAGSSDGGDDTYYPTDHDEL
ncbi:hypothetical protein CVT25_012712 [Psilocybe cyanescens]|uniref:Transcriptional coregulator SSA1 n=1 Tax=Psilocybe cyanescens TaxID=93625 RepID=A0A409XS62_PSICY|nr:hypothetical protein CVT25_012712 [Psilocybe cyanescens]